MTVAPTNTTEPTPPATQTCLTCEGAGETILGRPIRSFWGIWDAKTRPCTTCRGDGTIAADELICDICTVPFPADDQVCTHGLTLCGDDRGECRECAEEISTQHGFNDPWGDW